MDKLNGIYKYSRILFNQEKNEVLSLLQHDDPLKLAKWKKVVTSVHIWPNSIDRECPRQANS